MRCRNDNQLGGTSVSSSLVCIRCGKDTQLENCVRSDTSKLKVCAVCKTCAYAYRRQWVRNNPERAKLSMRKYYYNNRESRIALAKKITQRTPEKQRRWVSAYKKKNPHLPNEWSARRHARKLKATPVWADLKKIQEIYRLSKVLEQETGIAHNVDHIIPLKHPLVCGLHVHNNLRVITELENEKKHNSFHI